MVLFAALFVQLNLVQVVRADRYDTDPGNNRGRRPRLHPAAAAPSSPRTAW